MKAKTKLIASIMSVCLVCAVFAIGVFALRTANLKIGGDVSFSATGVEADIKNATLTGATTNDQVLAIGSINTTMTQTDIDSTFQNWQTLELDFNENADDIELKFEIANTSTNANNYIEIDYDYSFTTANPNVDVFPGDENAQGAWENNNYILAPKGATPAAGDYETFTLKFKVLDKELNVPDNTKVNLTIALKHITPSVGTLDGTKLTTSDGIIYTVNTTNHTASLGVTGFVGDNYYYAGTDVVIAPVVSDGSNNYIVTTIGGSAFNNYGNETGNTSLKTIAIPSSVTMIYSCAFLGCTGLTSITIPNSVTYIGSSAFQYCGGLTSITIPSGVTSIEDSAFRGCTGLTSITIPSDVRYIADFAFEVCYGLTSITIPSGVTSIGNYAFESCTSLTSITIPSSVTSIGNYAFESCTSLTSITIPSSVTTIEQGAFMECGNLASVTFDDPIGWVANRQSLDLSNPQTNATYLKDTYCMYTWTKA